MQFKTKLTEDMKQAMRDRDMVRLGALRYVLAEIKNVEIDNGEQDDAAVTKLIAGQVKQMRDAITDFEKGNREDLVKAEQEKIAILENYLPKQMSDAELSQMLDEVIAAAEPKDLKTVMPQAMRAVAGKADGGRVSAMVREKLAD